VVIIHRFVSQGKGIVPSPGYRKKIHNPGSDCPLSETYTPEQIERRIAFYRELNERRSGLPQSGKQVLTKFALHGWEDSTTVRVYMRETVSRISQELFISDYSLSVKNVHHEGRDGRINKDRGYVVVTLCATEPELHVLFEYIKPGASYYVYDGEESKYLPGDTASSEFIITKPEDPRQPQRFWRRSQSFISWIEELAE